MIKRYILILFLFITHFGYSQDNLLLEKYTLGDGLTIGNNKAYHTNLSFLLQPWVEGKTIDEFSEVSYRLRMRRARASLNYKISDRLSGRIRIDFTQRDGNSEDELLNGSLLDAYFSYDVFASLKVSIGQKSLFMDNRELKFSSAYLSFVERSRLVSAFASIRDMGIFIEGRHHLGKTNYLKSYLEVVSGDGQSSFGQNHGGLKYGGRIDYFPFGYLRGFGQFRGHDLFREWTIKLVFGAHGSYNNGISSRRGRQGGSIIYLDKDKNELLPDYAQFGFDVTARYRGFSLLAEFEKSWASIPEDIIYYVRADGSLKDNFDEGINAYARGKLMLGTISNFQIGYVFKNYLAMDLRYTRITPDKISFLLNDAFYNRNNYFGIGFTNYFFNQTVKIQIETIYNTSGDTATDINGNPLNGNGEFSFKVMTQIIF